MFINIFGYSREIAAQELYIRGGGSAPPVSDVVRGMISRGPRPLANSRASRPRLGALRFSRFSLLHRDRAFTDLLSELGWHVRARCAL
jgi:hypothetical protein